MTTRRILVDKTIQVTDMTRYSVAYIYTYNCRRHIVSCIYIMLVYYHMCVYIPTCGYCMYI